MSTGLDQETRELLHNVADALRRLAERDSNSPPHATREADPLTSRIAATHQLLTVTEACQRLRISRWGFYHLMHERQVNTVTIGRRRLVPADEVDRFVKELAARGARP